MNENDITTMLKANLERLPFNVNDIPAWVIDKACGKNAGFCIVSMQDGYIGIEHETDKAYLLYVENTFNTPKCAGWEFWVARCILIMTWTRTGTYTAARTEALGELYPEFPFFMEKVMEIS